ncbi:HNH endonuclease [Vibrio alginolyticus]|uniref:HNH endonuclease n=1 Tax=Vibrio alginolyticus TaxID=663 RepID=UPI0022AA443B|nr:HNH endonuclease signature motif containing protein [Vibrio alginolyticus]MCZ2798979.1 HNH endonuclease signature motif containing protein [Vibrio alginolyticus]
METSTLPAEFLAMLALGKVSKNLISNRQRKLAGRTVSTRVRSARKSLVANNELVPSYLSKKQQQRYLLMYYWDNKCKSEDKFYSSSPWRLLRVLIFDAYGEKCMKCNSYQDLAVDHIAPRIHYPNLKLDPSNMQILCRSCNSSKGAWKHIDFRPSNWKQLLSSVSEIDLFYRSLSQQDFIESNINLPNNLSFTRTVSVSCLTTDTKKLTGLLMPYYSRIAEELLSYNAEGSEWWIGVETDKGWLKKRWSAVYKNRKSLFKDLFKLARDEEISPVLKIHISAQKLRLIRQI